MFARSRNLTSRSTSRYGEVEVNGEVAASAPGDELDRPVDDLLAAQHAVVRAPLLDEERVVTGGRVQPPPAALDVAFRAIFLEPAEPAEIAVQLARGGAALVEREPHIADHDRFGRVAADRRRIILGQQAGDAARGALDPDHQPLDIAAV